MRSETLFQIEEKLQLEQGNIIHNPDHEFYREFLKPYYVFTKDGQYLFASTQPGRRPDRAFYMVPKGYKLGYKQQRFDAKVGKKIYDIVWRYLRDEKIKVIVMEGIQGEAGYEIGLRITISVDNPHSAYIGWMGKLMIFPPKPGMRIDCWNYVVPEPLPTKYVTEIQSVWDDYDPAVPLTLYDFTELHRNVRRVMSLGVDYFGGAFKKPHLTMVWNKGEAEGMISYHAGCTSTRVIKGLSGTGKTTLSVGPELEQDDACLGKLIYNAEGKIERVQLIGLEAASYAKSEGLHDGSPEWPGLMKSRYVDKNGNRPVVLAQNIDCENVEYVYKHIGKYRVKVPQPIKGETVGSLQCTKYDKSGTTNGRFIFLFSELNPNWGSSDTKYLHAESLSFKRFDVLEPVFRVTDPTMAVALDSACETIITSAILAQKIGTRVRSYAATDFMVREQSHQALLKWRMYRDLGLGLDGKLIFFITNSGYVGEYDINGDQIRKLDEHGNPIPKRDPVTGELLRNEIGEILYEGQGEKITVQDTKKLVYLVEHRKIKNWISNPIYGYIVPEPRELEEVHGLKNFRKRFNLLRYYTADQIIAFAKRDIEERTKFLQTLFRGQEGVEELAPVINVWKNIELPSPDEVQTHYEQYYGKV